MKKRVGLSILLICGLSLVVALTGCNGSSSSTSPSTLYSLTGTWEFSPNDNWAFLVLYLNQNGENVTGTADRAPALKVITARNDTGNLTAGTNRNNAINLTIQFEDTQILELQGTITSATAMNGTARSYYPGDTPEDFYQAWSATKSQ